MVRATTLFIALSLVAGSAVAFGAPSTRDATGGRSDTKQDVQLDRAALFRPARVAECGAVQRERVASQPPRQRDRARPPQKNTAANFGCNAVWSD